MALDGLFTTSNLSFVSSSGTVGSHHRRNMMRRRPDVLVLSVLISSSTINIRPVVADGWSIPTQTGPFWAQRTPATVDPEEDSHSHRSRSRIRPWYASSTFDPSPTSSGCSFHHSKPTQSVGEQSTKPAVLFSAQALSKTIDGVVADDDEDDEHEPVLTDPNSRPVPTKWLMLGYSRVADIPTSLPVATGQRQDYHHSRFSSANSLNHQIPGSQRDWMQDSKPQFVGGLILFVILVLIMEGLWYLWRNCCQRKDMVSDRGKVALYGDEKQLRAFRGDIESRFDIAATGLICLD